MTRSGTFGYSYSSTAGSFADAAEYCATNFPGSTLPIIKSGKDRDDLVKAIENISGSSKILPIINNLVKKKIGYNPRLRC